MRISSFLVIGFCAGLTGAACTTAEGGGEERPWTVDAGALKLRVSEDPWNMTFFDAPGGAVLVELPAMDDGPSGSFGMYLGPPTSRRRSERVTATAGRWRAIHSSAARCWLGYATRAESSDYEGGNASCQRLLEQRQGQRSAVSARAARRPE
jgi:hypothetical protein